MRKVVKDLLPHPKIALSTPFFICSRRRDGVALILTVGVLALMALIGTSFAVNMFADYKGAKNFHYLTDARNLAEAGINRAIAELLYGTQGFVSDAIDSSTEMWAGTDPFSANIGPDNSGYVVNKISDCAGRIHLNDTNPNLRVMLGNLAAACGLAVSDGQAIFDNRPAAGYSSLEEIKMVPGFDAAKYAAISDFLTIYAYIDADVSSAAYPYLSAPRAPVNVNTAAKEVLIAVLSGISNGANTVTQAEAASLADHLINGRPYSTYENLRDRLLTAETLGYISDGDASVVMANANPNTDIMRFNPNYSWRYKHVSKGDPSNASGYDGNGMPYAVDKTSLSVYTTEFSFNSGGYYEIVSTGIVRNSAGVQVATRSIRACVKLFDLWRQTTQTQFAAGSSSNVSSYPEPPAVTAASYDGQIMLSFLHSSEPVSGTPHFLHKMASLDAFSAGGNPNRSSSAWVPMNPNAASVIDASDPGNLYPDGLFFPRDDAVTNYWFYPENNIDSADGTLEIWFKPNWQYHYATFNNSWHSAKVFEAQNRGTGGGGFSWSNSSMDIYIAADDDTIRWRINNKNGTQYTWPMAMPATWRPGTWHQIAITWDYEDYSGDPARAQVFYIDGIGAPAWNIKDAPNQFLGDNGLEFGCDTPYQEPPNATYGEIRIFASSTATSPGIDYAAGVYYDVGDANFVSSSETIGPARLGTISWTEHITDSSGNPVVPGADLTFDVFDGTSWLGNSAGRSNPAGNPLNVITAGAGTVQYRVNFLENGSGLFDTPVLDDVTVTYTKKAKILYRRDS